jgi:dihydrofolate reductase
MSLLRPGLAPLRVVAIAAMAENRVIGRGNALPWNLPEDLKWFRECTRGKTLLMGRKTYASIGRPLPHRRTLVLSRSPVLIPGVSVVADLAGLPAETGNDSELWVCGGAEIYALTLHWWDELLLTRIKRTIHDGDAFFPSFEDRFELEEVIRETPDLRIERHVPIEAA